MKSRTKLKRIVCGVPSGKTFVERILRGVLDYADNRGSWSFIRVPERLDPSLDWLRGCGADGAFVMVSNEEEAMTARSLPMPVVNLSSYLEIPGLPTVTVDQREIGKMAARHLLERSFSRYAYYGTSDMWYSRVRRESFVETIEAAGGECEVLEVPSFEQNQEGWTRQQQSLERWLHTLRAPVGIMASTDLRACMAADACVHAGLRIPEDVALVGVDNDPVSELHDPPLSSVSRNDSEVGLYAATLLDHLMAGGSPPPGPVLVAPDAVISRLSTESMAIDDARIARTVAYIHKNVHRPFGVEELLDVACMPRRTFEQHFLKTIGITPYSFINRCRVEHATFLLAGTKPHSLTEIASRSGFSDLRRFRLVFHRLMGMPPAVYKRQYSAVPSSKREFFESLTGQGRSNRMAVS